MTFREALTAGTQVLENAGVPDAELDSRYLLEEICGITRAEFYLKEKEELDEEAARHFETAIKERGRRVPLQYILGSQEFMGLTFTVNDHVLIPRQDTETLVETVLPFLREGEKVLDLGTGSGCIAVALKKNCPAIELTASDASKQALLVAKENAKRNGTEMTFARSDVFDNLSAVFDVIVSNPPYIKSDVIPILQPEVAEFEPVEALDGSPDGLHFYRRIADGLEEHLTAGGRIFVEIGHDQAEEVTSIFREAGLKEITVVKDLAGQNRVVFARKEELCLIN